MTYPPTTGQPGSDLRLAGASRWRLPTPLWVGLAVGLLGFFLELSASASSTRNGEVVSCSHFDLGPWVVVAGLGVCLLLGFRRHLSRRVDYRAHVPTVMGAAAVISALALVHVARGLGVFGGGPC